MGKPIQAKTIGLVGVRRGLTHAQFQTLCRILVTQKGRGALAGVEVAHRSNDGWSGADLSRIARWMGSVPKLVIHDSGRPIEEPPPISTESMASWAEFSLDSEFVPPWNREIVDESELILACPPVAEEEYRSRTWGTVRYARSQAKAVVVIYPNGTVDVGGQPFYLVKETQAGETLMVFLCRDPKAEGYPGVSVRPAFLETLPHEDRVEAVRPVVGRSKQSAVRYREFPTRRALHHAGFEEVGAYRVCDSWEDYHFPWELASSDTSESGQTGETNAEARNTNPYFNKLVEPGVPANSAAVGCNG